MPNKDDLSAQTAPAADSANSAAESSRQMLRKRAEEITRSDAAQSSVETQRTLHELQVHQIELEMQNEELRRAQVELEATQARYFDLYDLAPVGYCTLNKPGLILEANLTAATLLGVTRSSLVMQPFTRFILREDQDIFYHHRQQLFATGASQVAEMRLVRADETIFWANLEATAAIDTDGAPVCRLVMSDISERKLVGAYGVMGRDILEILNEPVDLQNSIARVIAALQRQTGFAAVGIRLEDGDDFPYFAQSGFSEDFLKTENTLVERSAEGGVCRDKDGKVRLECTCGLVISGQTDPTNPLFTEGGSCWTNNSLPLLDIPPGDDPRLHPRNRCIHHGYTSVALVPIRNQERIVGLIQLNDRRQGCLSLAMIERLEDIASHIGAALMRHRAEEALHQASEELRRSNLDLEQFAYVAGHDLQEPLRIISGFLKILESRYAAQLDDKAREYIGFSVASAQRMSQLINDLLAYARVGRETGLVSVDIGVAVEVAVLNLQAPLAESGANLTHDPLPSVRANVGELAQVFQNLLGNAIKFRRPGVAPEIHIGVEKSSGRGVPAAGEGILEPQALSPDTWLFSVRDNGLGLDPRYGERIFTIFQRLHGREQYPGTGVGLAICKKIVERHGGRIWVESVPGQGAMFRFTLPA